MIVLVKCATKNTQFGNVMCSREWNIERSGRRRRNLDCVTVAWGKGILVTHVLGTECGIDGCKGHQMALNYTINHVREKYLVVHIREQVKRVMRERFECARRFRSKPAHQQMAPLPKIRLQQSSRPFESCAVDFGGPFLTKQGRGRVRAKRYLCLFLCLKTHCCHLEMASSLDTDAFLNAFVRMTARRGWPQQMLSDNGTNFVSASRELRDLVSAIDQDKIQRMTSSKRMSWKWNPTAAPI